MAHGRLPACRFCVGIETAVNRAVVAGWSWRRSTSLRDDVFLT